MDDQGEIWDYDGPLFEGNPDGNGLVYSTGSSGSVSQCYQGNFYRGQKIGEGILTENGKGRAYFLYQFFY